MLAVRIMRKSPPPQKNPHFARCVKSARFQCRTNAHFEKNKKIKKERKSGFCEGALLFFFLNTGTVRRCVWNYTVNECNDWVKEWGAERDSRRGGREEKEVEREGGWGKEAASLSSCFSLRRLSEFQQWALSLLTSALYRRFKTKPCSWRSRSRWRGGCMFMCTRDGQWTCQFRPSVNWKRSWLSVEYVLLNMTQKFSLPKEWLCTLVTHGNTWPYWKTVFHLSSHGQGVKEAS